MRNMSSTPPDHPRKHSILGKGITASLLFTIALQNAVPPLATDMYSPSFPEITRDLSTTATSVGLTLTAFFIGFGIGQIGGGAISDHKGRRGPMILGGLIAIIGSLICVFAPSIHILFIGRILQGIGGGAASAVARAILVDIAHGNVLAKVMSLLQAIGGLAPMIAPVLGGLIVTYWLWRAVFWCLTAFTVLMTLAAWMWAPESLPPNQRHGGGLRKFFTGIRSVMTIRPFLGYMLTSAFSGFCMFAYVADSSYVLQDMLNLTPIAFSLVFAGNALLSTLLALVNIRLIGYVQPDRLIAFGLSLAALGVALVTLSVFVCGLPLILTCVAFAILMSANAFIFGNSGALALSKARKHAGTASAVQGLVQSIAVAVSSPLATAGGGHSAVPMTIVMLIGTLGAWVSFRIIARGKAEPRSPQPL